MLENAENVKLKKNLLPLERHLATFFARQSINNVSVLVAVSGGMDSMALLHGLSQIAPLFRLKIVVGHVHHGKHKNPGVVRFRNQASQFVADEADRLGFEAEILSYLGESQDSEAALRAIRRENLKKQQENSGCAWQILAHHADDLLETRLLRMIRGVGGEALTSMSERGTVILRPFLSLSRKEINHYQKERGFKFVEDPSNCEDVYFRNWLRKHWLEPLESFQPGANQSLGRSFSLIAEEFNHFMKNNSKNLECVFFEDKIIRKSFETLLPFEKRRVLRAYLSRKKLPMVTFRQLKEICAQLDRPKTRFTFSLGTYFWKVDTEHISAQR